MVERWLAGDGSEFDWSPFVVRALEHEGVASPTKADVAQRCAQIRSVVRKVTSCDIYASPPVEVEGLFDVVVSNDCLDAVTNDKAQWHENIRNVKGLLRPGGLFVIASLLDATYSDFGHTRYPNVRLQETDVREALEATGFEPASIRLVSAPADHAGREYRGVVLAAATH
jgi:SAM-dependent methyltransferase